MRDSCLKCGRDKEQALLGAPAKSCYLCIGEEIDLLGSLKSIQGGGLREIEKESKCSICERRLQSPALAARSDFGYFCEPCYSFFQNNIGKPIPEVLRDSKTWISKSSLIINGPYNSSRVINGIKAREFASLDELCAPRGFWKYLRDIPDFHEQVEESSIRSLQEDRTADITSGMTASSFGTDPGVRNHGSAQTMDTPFVDSKSVTNRRFKRPSLGRIPMLFVVASIAIVGVYVLQSKLVGRADSTEFQIEMSRNALSSYWMTGQLRSYLQESRNINLNGFSLTNNEEIRKLAAEIELGDFFSANTSLKLLSNSANQLEVKMLEAKLLFLEAKSSQAKATLQELYAKYPEDERVAINLSYMQILEGKLLEGKKNLPNSVGYEDLNSSRQIVEFYFLSKSGYQLKKSELNSIKDRAANFLDISTTTDLYMAVLYNNNQLRPEALNSIAKALNRDPKLEHSFKKNLFMIPLADRYRRLQSLISETSFDDDFFEESALSLVQTLQGKKDRAKKTIVRAMKSNPENALMQTWLEFLETGTVAKIPIKISPVFLDYSSPLRLRLTGAKCLEEGRIDCADKVNSKLLSFDPRDVSVLAQRVEIYKRKGAKALAKESFKQAIGYGPRYIPLLLVEDQYL